MTLFQRFQTAFHVVRQHNRFFAGSEVLALVVRHLDTGVKQLVFTDGKTGVQIGPAVLDLLVRVAVVVGDAGITGVGLGVVVVADEQLRHQKFFAADQVFGLFQQFIKERALDVDLVNEWIFAVVIDHVLTERVDLDS